MRALWLLFAQTVTVVLGAVFVVTTLKPAWLVDAARRDGADRRGAATALPLPSSPSQATASAPPQVALLPSGAAPASMPASPAGNSFSTAVRRAAPAVVSITASRTSPKRGAQDEGSRWFFGGNRSRNSAQIGLGSGVLVSPDGYLLTNQHVVEGADDIEVTLADGRSASAKIVGTDADSDLAVLRIALSPVPVIPFGRMDSLSVGDPVLAIGNPFNVGQTVTSGIVSALDRNQLGLSTIENFIQTDAAINPGNSGGALVDGQGRLVGINTAIFSRNGGSMGIGFAIPVDMAREVMDALIHDGQVVRGWIGVQPRDLSAEFADSFQLPVHQGVLITGIVQEGPAAKAGLRPGDVVTSLAGQAITNTAQLLRGISALKPPARAELEVQRGDQVLKVSVPVARRPARARDATRDPE
jgi:Do/DeqQ family serine protease